MSKQENSPKRDGLYISDLLYSVLRSRRDGENDLRRLCSSSSKEGLWLFVSEGPNGPFWVNLVSSHTQKGEAGVAGVDIGHDYAEYGWKKVVVYNLRPNSMENDYFKEICAVGISPEKEPFARNYARLCLAIPPPEDIESYVHMIRSFSGRQMRIKNFFSLGQLEVSVTRKKVILPEEINQKYRDAYDRLFKPGSSWIYCQTADPHSPLRRTILRINKAMMGMVKLNFKPNVCQPLQSSPGQNQ